MKITMINQINASFSSGFIYTILLLLLATGLQTSCVESNITDGHEWVDLGLQSGTLWATCNVGANSPEEYGDYFAWGEIQSKDIYNYDTYRHFLATPKTKNGFTVTKYCGSFPPGSQDFSEFGPVDNRVELEPEDDAATVNWGENWQTPSLDQLDELFHSGSTIITWTTINGVSGRSITSKKNGNSIFLPAAGHYSEKNWINKNPTQSYWTRTLFDPVLAFSFDLYNPNSLGWNFRYMGMTVRPVRKK